VVECSWHEPGGFIRLRSLEEEAQLESYLFTQLKASAMDGTFYNHRMEERTSD